MEYRELLMPNLVTIASIIRIAVLQHTDNDLMLMLIKNIYTL